MPDTFLYNIPQLLFQVLFRQMFHLVSFVALSAIGAKPDLDAGDIVIQIAFDMLLKHIKGVDLQHEYLYCSRGLSVDWLNL